ncbi:MAG: ion channel [Gammaproteobacteria bacterium]|nr:ion channel [Gammaproteobacteria bacterium]
MSCLRFNEGTGVLIRQYPEGLPDYIYLSTTTYTTLGYGDLVPTGPVRAIYGTESLVGLVLITWSASLTFLEIRNTGHRK